MNPLKNFWCYFILAQVLFLKYCRFWLVQRDWTKWTRVIFPISNDCLGNEEFLWKPRKFNYKFGEKDKNFITFFGKATMIEAKKKKISQKIHWGRRIRDDF
ncbi:MAG: hypothetical protein E4G98_00810 [Promethearchaeota archaeon]|nr:MAG: hypothetical protein E4G98_00810 [Candidatus Lokiarchaeota archaeon]